MPLNVFLFPRPGQTETNLGHFSIHAQKNDDPFRREDKNNFHFLLSTFFMVKIKNLLVNIGEQKNFFCEHSWTQHFYWWTHGTQNFFLVSTLTECLLRAKETYLQLMRRGAIFFVTVTTQDFFFTTAVAAQDIFLPWWLRHWMVSWLRRTRCNIFEGWIPDFICKLHILTKKVCVFSLNNYNFGGIPTLVENS